MAEENTSLAESSNLDISPRERYLQRREAVEQAFLNNPAQKDMIELEDGASVRVISNLYRVPEDLKSQNPDFLSKAQDEENVTIFVPGIFHSPGEAHFSGDPLEIKLAASLLKGEVDDVVILKPEGVNDKAYSDDESGAGEKKVVAAAFRVLQERLAESSSSKPNKKYKFRVIGYSEGSTQAISLAAQIAESGLGEVVDFTSLCGFGFGGVVNQSEISPLTIATRFLGKRTTPTVKFPIRDNQGNNLYHLQQGDDVFVATKLIGDKKAKGGFEASLGQAKVDNWAAVKDISQWATRLGESIPAENNPLANRIFGPDNRIPWGRMQATYTQNPDLDKLVEKQIPINLAAGYQDELIPYQLVRQTVDALRKKGGNVLMISYEGGHSTPHIFPSGMAYALEAFGDKTRRETTKTTNSPTNGAGNRS